jgi:hypothetical protein
MVQINQRDVISEIDVLETIYLQCRSVFPALNNTLIGHTEFKTAEYYVHRGFSAQIRMSKSITQDFLKQHAKLVKWINENTIIRLHGIMYHYGFLKKIDQNCSGWKEVNLMRLMRNAFTKTRLNYRPLEPKNIRLRYEIIEHFKLDKNLYKQGEIPTPIDTVVEPIFESCRKYIKAKIS